MAEQRERRKRFRAALALAGMTQEGFAGRKDVGVSPEHVSLVLYGRRVSAPLLAKIDSFIAKHLGEARVA